MTDMRLETTSENIARDMAEGRFPERSPPKMVPVALPDELDVAIKRAIARLQNLHDYAGSPTWERVLEEELGAIFSQAHSTIAARRAERNEADNALVDKYRDPKTGSFKFPGDVAAIVRRLETAEAEVKRLTEEKEALMAEVVRCHARLEIDHVFVAEGDDFVRREVPMGERLSIPDAVECRDATISILEADARKAMESKE